MGGEIMAKLQIFAEMGEFNYLGDVIDESSLAVTEQTTTTFTLTDVNGAKITFTGTGLTYDGETPAGGKFSAAAFFNSDGDKIAEYSGGKFKFASLGNQDLQNVFSIATFLNMGNDTVLGSSVGDDLFAGNNEGNDTIKGLAGDDFVKAWEGDNVYDGGDGDDTLTFQETFYEPDSVKKGIVLDVAKGTIKNGWGGADEFKNFEQYRGSHLADKFLGSKAEFEQFAGLGGADNINGGKGTDRVRYDRDAQFDGDSGISADLSKNKIVDGFGKTDKVTNVEQVVGTAFADNFTGDDKDNKFRGLDGVDSFNGKGGSDAISFYSDDADNGVDIDLSLVSNQIIDDGFGNTETATSIESVEGTSFGDTIKLGATDEGYAAGDEGDDTLIGGEGLWQYLDGGNGSDTFAFLTASAIGLDETGGIDTIGDFVQGEDTIDLSAIADFMFIGTMEFMEMANELRYETDGGKTLVYGDVDGDGEADFKLQLNGTYTLTAEDFGLMA
jgi:serralysin